MEKAPELLTADEVAALLRVSRSSVSRWVKSGVLTGVRIGGVLRFRRGDVLAVMTPPAGGEPAEAVGQ